MTKQATVHIVDDDEAMRKSLKLLMKSIDLHAETYHSAEDFLENFQDSTPSCVLMDVRMPGMQGLDLLALLPTKNINVPVVMMTGHGDIPSAVKAIKAGAVDFIEKPFDQEALTTTIKKCIQTSAVRSKSDTRQIYSEKLALLSRRETEVLDRLVKGKINKVIAADLNISVRTVEAHRANIMAKLGVNSLSDLVKISIYSQINKTSEAVRE